MNKESLDRLLNHLGVLTKDNGILATLRRSINKESEANAYRYLMPWCKSNNEIEFLRKKSVVFFVAWAYSQLRESVNNSDYNFGTALNVLKKQDISEDTVDTYFKIICSATTLDEVIDFFARVVLLCESKGVRINLQELGISLYYWESDNYKTKMRWARSLYS